MENYKKELLISRICCGYLRYKANSKLLLIKAPTLDLLYEANEIYANAYEDGLNRGVMTDKDILAMLIDRGVWDTQKENEYQDILPKHIEYWKEELYKSRTNKGQKEKVIKYLKIAREELDKLTIIRHAYDYAACHGVAAFAKTQFIIERCTFLPASKKHYSWSNASLYKAMTFYQENLIREENMRELSHTYPWDNIWSAGRKNGQLFPKCGVELTGEQQRLILWSGLYDSIHESGEPPTKDVINNDDMLDGWLSLKRKNQLGEKGTGITNPKIANADEVFLPAKTLAEAREIDNFNDRGGRAVKKRIMAAVAKQGEVADIMLPHMQERLMMEATQKLSKSRK